MYVFNQLTQTWGNVRYAKWEGMDNHYFVFVGEDKVGVIHGPNNYDGWGAWPWPDYAEPVKHHVRGFKTRRFATEYLLKLTGVWPYN